MGDFKKFLKSDGKKAEPATPQLPPAGSKANVAVRPEASVAAPALPTGTLADRKAAYAQQGVQKQGRFAILLDATGSMGCLIQMAKSEIGAIITNLSQETKGKATIVMVAYRDYIDMGPLVEVSEESGDAEYFVRWLQGIHAQGGGGNEGEAMDAGLREVEKRGKFDAILVAGDEPSLPNPSKYGPDSEPARTMAKRMGTPIHTFAMGERPDCVADFRTIASLSGGEAGQLDGSEAMRHMAVMAMLKGVRGASAVRVYMDRYAGQLPATAETFGRLLLGSGKK